MKNILKIASAIIGAVMGAGFASGQEVMQYFTSFGQIGVLGTVVLTILFGVASFMVVDIGYRSKAVSHVEVVRKISGRYLGLGYDVVIMLTLFGIGVVMLAGSGPVFTEQYNIPTYVGTIGMAALVLITIMAGVKRVVNILAVVTPIFLAIIIFVNVFSIINGSSATNLEQIATEQPSITNHWLTSTLNNLSLLIIMNAAMLFILGGSETNGKQAVTGALVGGLACGLLFMVSNAAIYQNINIVAVLEMPTLGLANEISPLLGFLYSITLFGMIYSTAVSMFFALISRFFKPKTTGFRITSIGALAIGTFLAFYGFSDLVSIVFPAIGYMGYIFIFILIIGFFRVRKMTSTRKIKYFERTEKELETSAESLTS